MLKKYLTLVLTVLLTNVLIAVPVLAQSQSNRRTPTIEEIKIKVAKLGVGEKARATAWLKDGTKIKGYITEARDDEFVMRDRQTNNPHTIAYQSVVKLDSNRGHSLARNLGIGIAIGAGAVIVVIAALVASLD